LALARRSPESHYRGLISLHISTTRLLTHLPQDSAGLLMIQTASLAENTSREAFWTVCRLLFPLPIFASGQVYFRVAVIRPERGLLVQRAVVLIVRLTGRS